MKLLIYNYTDKYQIDINNVKFISIEELKNYILKQMIKYNNIYNNLYTLKDLNNNQKLMFDIIMNDYFYLNMLTPKYYLTLNIIENIKLLDILVFKPIFRDFFHHSDILNNSKIILNYKNILQIGIVPSFLEALIEYNKKFNVTNKYNYIKNSPLKLNEEIYNSLIDDFHNKYSFVNINKEEFNYQKFINLNFKFDFIIIENYKNFSKIKLDSVLRYYKIINTSYFDSFLANNYIFKHILFALEYLNEDGSFIFALSAYKNKIYNQFISILKSFFEEVKFISSILDYSFRYYIVCYKYKFNSNLFAKLKNIKLKNNSILISLSNYNIKNKFINKIKNKFILFKNNILIFQNIFDSSFINFINNNLFNLKLIKSYNFIRNIFSKSLIDEKIEKNIMNTNNIYISFFKKSSFYKIYNISKDSLEINFIINQVEHDQITNIINSLNYNKFMKLYKFKKWYNKFYDNRINIINFIIKNFKLNKIKIIDLNINLNILGTNINEYFLNNFNSIILILNISNILPTFINLLYIFIKFHDESFIYISDYQIKSIFLICKNKNIINNILLESIIKNDNHNTIFISFSDFFIKQINKIFIDIIKYKINNILILKYFSNIIKKNNLDKK